MSGKTSSSCWHAALAEDLGQKGDITSCSMIPAAAQGAARLVARSPGVLAGLPVVELLARTFEPRFDWLPELADGDRVERGSVVGRLEGPMRSLLAIERTALNFVQHLSGIASLTARMSRRSMARPRRSSTRARPRLAGVFSRNTLSAAAGAGITGWVSMTAS